MLGSKVGTRVQRIVKCCERKVGITTTKGMGTRPLAPLPSCRDVGAFASGVLGPGSPRARPRIFLDLGERANPRSDGVGAVRCGVGDGRGMDVLVLVREEAVLERWV